MFTVRGTGCGSFIAGKSGHNQRIKYSVAITSAPALPPRRSRAPGCPASLLPRYSWIVRRACLSWLARLSCSCRFVGGGGHQAALHHALLPSIKHTCLPSARASAILDSPGVITCLLPSLYLSVCWVHLLARSYC